MRITADTNILVRMATRDDEEQARKAFAIASKAERVMLPLPCILELVWVLESVYGFARDEIVEALLTLVRMKNVSTDFVAIEAGIKVYSAGGDFADGVIAAAGISMGADIFISFDRKAVAHVGAIGMRAELATQSA
jgi:predicted nucleic-acid-binding protein